jgi:HEXXH motif-containing protein
MLEAGDPDSHDELRVLLRAIVLAAPEDAAALETFNGASTFFMWGATLLNAARTRDLASTIDVLVHEGSHMLLFGASADKGLTTNAGEERHASPLRSDGRPVDGIFHACYVATRVYVVMDRLLDSDRLPAGDRDPLAARRHRNGEAARASLETLNRYAKPTETGEAILDTLRDFWAAAV